MDLYGAAFRRVLYPAWEGGLRRRPTLQRLRYLERSQWRSLDELAAVQAGELRRLLRHAFAHVPFYRAGMEQAGVAPESIRTVEDLARLPILTRTEAIDSQATRASTAPPLPTIHKGTSGTLGTPLQFGYDPGSEYWRQAVKIRGWGWAGYRPGDRILYYWGGSSGATPPAGERAKIAVDRFLRRERYFDCSRRSPEELDRVVAAIRRMRPHTLICYTQAGVDLARRLLERGIGAGDLAVLCCAERLFPSDRRLLVEAFGPRVFETYGSREVMLMASECEAHDGLHLSVENLVIEVVVREGGVERPARPGEVGEVLVTDLHNFGMPFIRYANGDLAVAGKPERCACGRALPRLASVDGRVTETLRDGRGDRVSGMIFAVIFAAAADTVRRFQVVQHRDRSLTLKLVPTPSFDEEVRARIVGTCARYLPGLPLAIETVDDIPLSATGKRRVVVVEE